MHEPQPHRGGRRWRRFARQNRQIFFLGFLMVFVVAAVALLFWLMTSPRFVKPY